jgi:hypothetical protein
MPAIVTTDLRLNEPRYASLPNIMKAKKKAARHENAGRLRRRYRAALKSSRPSPSRRSAKPASKSNPSPNLRRQAEKRSGSDLMAVLLIAEHNNDELNELTAKAADRRREIGSRRACSGCRPNCDGRRGSRQARRRRQRCCSQIEARQYEHQLAEKWLT